MRRLAAAATAAALSLAVAAAHAQEAGRGSSEPTLSTGFRFSQQTGEGLYTHACQGCHMPDGRGATGAGTYPALAGNPNLAAAGYPLHVVLNGLRGMPPIGSMMSDDQAAAVINYVRTHFGNDYQDAVTAEEVKAARR